MQSPHWRHRQLHRTDGWLEQPHDADGHDGTNVNGPRTPTADANFGGAAPNGEAGSGPATPSGIGGGAGGRTDTPTVASASSTPAGGAQGEPGPASPSTPGGGAGGAGGRPPLKKAPTNRSIILQRQQSVGGWNLAGPKTPVQTPSRLRREMNKLNLAEARRRWRWAITKVPFTYSQLHARLSLALAPTPPSPSPSFRCFVTGALLG